MKRLKVAILGTGNIGTDLLIKILKNDFLDLQGFVGRNSSSKGIAIAKRLGVYTSTNELNAFINDEVKCDLVYDCTNTHSAIKHAVLFKEKGIKVVDLTPAKVGELCVPSINEDAILINDNVNMITCGGQAAIPLINLISKNCDRLDYVELVSQIASKSAGMATRINVDSYIHTTEDAIQKFANPIKCKVILNLNPAIPEVYMQATMFIKGHNIDFRNLQKDIDERISIIKTYIPGYELALPPIVNEQGVLILSLKITGAGDYLPQYAGNLDIITSAAIKITKRLWESLNA